MTLTSTTRYQPLEVEEPGEERNHYYHHVDDGHDHFDDHGHCHDHDHDHNHDHDHDHNHDHGHSHHGKDSCGHDHGGWRAYLPHSHGLEERLKNDARTLSVALFILILAFSTQLGGSIIAKSDMLAVEAVHTALDGITVVISLIAVTIATKKPTARFSYGFGRAEVISALISVLALALLCVKLFVRAAGKVWNLIEGKWEVEVQGMQIVVAEGVALAANLFMACVLTRGSATLNIRALRAHVIADSIENVLVLVAGGLIWAKRDMAWVDPVMTVVIATVIVYMNMGIGKEAVAVLLQGAPDGFNIRGLTARVKKVYGVMGVDPVGVWLVTAGKVVGNARVFVNDVEWEEVERVRVEVKEVMQNWGVHDAMVEVCRREEEEEEESV